MSVKSVWGECNGQIIVFSRNEEAGTWDVPVPFAESGEYYLTVYAEDFAGNQGYYATLLLVIDKGKLLVTVRILHLSKEAKSNLTCEPRMSAWRKHISTTLVEA